ncbi:MAG: hypothetical protein LBE86_07630 [Gemmobacter sp.]|jgi:cytochrome c biogenesis protein CcdA|nr:hypothetical protein [Gemmobacter sp.]
MIVITAAILGALIGVFRARAHGGGALDMAQWAAGFAIAFALLAAFATIFIERSI